MLEQSKLSQIFSSETIAPITTLLIDDSQAVRRMVAPMLNNFGVNVVGEASNGQEGLASYKKLKPDVVFLDIVMPLVSGIEILKGIREINPNAIVVMLTSIASREDVLESKKAGAFAYLLKPFDVQKIERLITEIKRKLAKERKRSYD
ncbi:response regulator [Candidatus Poribacteria bacterium]|nr:response regulator [Candidatus Poribacteria bacterium]